jgi:UDP-N-acetyl-D-mannosaminuronic acid dehydrogenase
MARPVFRSLKQRFPHATWRGYDAVVAAPQIHEFGLQPCASVEAAFKGAHLAVILNNHPVFASLALGELSGHMARPALIYDFWNCFSGGELSLAEDVTYMALGSHGRARPAARRS